MRMIRRIMIWALLSLLGVPLSLALVGDPMTSITLSLLFLGTGIDLAVEASLPSYLSRVLTKLRYLLAPWGIVAVPASLLLVMGLIRDIWPASSLILVLAGLPALRAKYGEDLRLDREESRFLFAAIRASTLASLALVLVAAVEAARSHEALLVPALLYLLSVPINVRGPRELVPLIEMATLYSILLIAAL